MQRVTAASGWQTFRGWPGWARVTTYVAAGLALLLVLGLLAVVVLVRRPLPQTDGALTVPGLGGEVEVFRDAQGVPQVYADDASDLFFAQGFVQAQDRFYEMDVRRLVTAGRLAELVGEPAVETDLVVRTLGWRRVAEQELDLLSPEAVSYLESYSAGVNAWLADRDTTELAAEYTVLALGGRGYRPEEWTPVDSLAWLKAMAWDLRGNMEDEVQRTRLAVRRTATQVDELYPGFPYQRHAPILPRQDDPPADDAGAADPGADDTAAAGRPAPAYDEEQVAPALERVEQVVAAIPDLLGSGDGLGSNSWVVSGEHTVSGQPLLANDPHLGVSQPGIWYQMGLHCRELSNDCPFDVSGFTFAGVPGVVIGHNREVAWGLTNLDPDVTDLYLEQVEDGTYLYDGDRVALQQRDEVIRVAGGETRTITVRATRHGPLLSDVSSELSSVGANAQAGPDAPERGNGYAVALAWTALTPRPTLDALFGFNRATDWEEFREAARDFAVPSQNLVYADTAGNIGYQAPGAIPIRKGGRDGRYPASGWDPADDWTDRTIPFERLPSRLNPQEGFVVTANQAVTTPDYPYLITADPDLGYRSQRIRRLLIERIESGSRLDTADMERIQGDTVSPAAAVLVPYLLRQLMTSEYYADGQRLLVGWDFDQPADSAAAAYFNAVWRNVLSLTFHDDVPEELWPDGGDRWVAVVDELLRDPGSPWWDDATTEGVIEDRDVVLSTAMQQARDDLTRALSVSPRQWSWGRLHQLRLEHQTVGQSDVGPVRALFNRGPFPVGGGSASVDATDWYAPEGYDVDSAPSMRMVVDLVDLDRSRWVNLTGASGHPASAHYRDQVETWAEGGSYPWAFTKDAVAETTEDKLLLRPAD